MDKGRKWRGGMHRREFLLNSISAGIVARAGECFAALATDPIRAALEQTVGMRNKVAGMVAVIVDEGSTW